MSQQPISDHFVPVADFTAPLEAELARARLEAEGFRVFVLGGEAASTLSGVGATGGPIRVQVPEADAARATSILIACTGESELDHDWQDQVANAADLWVCTLCGEAVPNAETVCPSCQSERTALRPARQDVVDDKPNKEETIVRKEDISGPQYPRPSHSELMYEPDLPASPTFLGDDLARRAFLTGLFGLAGICGTLSWIASILALCGVFTFYSYWLLGKLFLFRGDLGPRGLLWLYAAFAINGAALFLWLGFVILMHYQF